MPQLTPRERDRCWAALARLEPGDTAMVHHDLAPDHLLCREGALVAVIDFGDACIDQPIADVGGRLVGEYGRESALALFEGDHAGVVAADAYVLWDGRRGAAAELRSDPPSDSLAWVRRELASSCARGTRMAP